LRQDKRGRNRERTPLWGEFACPEAFFVFDFSLAPSPNISVRRVGDEGEPVMVVDGVMRAPTALVDYAAGETFATPPGGENFYPGLLAPAPLEYVGALCRALAPAIIEAFELEDVTLAGATCNYSLVTLPPERLNTAQRLPHVDTEDPLQFAVLHYLCDAPFGGTAFYRHRATGFETLRPERVARYKAVLAEELGASPPPPAYINGDTAQHERIGEVAAKFDRVAVYRSRLLHSGLIAPDAPLSGDPRNGRLTANVFLNFRAV
jgi:hypothetical protein